MHLTVAFGARTLTQRSNSWHEQVAILLVVCLTVDHILVQLVAWPWNHNFRSLSFQQNLKKIKRIGLDQVLMWKSDTDPGLQDPVLWPQYTNTHGLQKSCGGKGAVWPLSKLERGPKRESQPPPGQAFIVFLGILHGRWSSFTMHRFTTADYLLRTTKAVSYTHLRAHETF